MSRVEKCRNTLVEVLCDIVQTYNSEAINVLHRHASVVNMKRTVPILIVIPILTSAFYTRHSPDIRTNTHETITEVGTLQALSSYIWKNKLKKIGSEISAVEVFYEKDATSKIEMGKSINAIIQAIADTQVEKKDTAYVHCHADQILLGNNI
ncbi:hypothetical protein AM593_03993, partial [Mytilus galloprovincialis]